VYKRDRAPGNSTTPSSSQKQQQNDMSETKILTEKNKFLDKRAELNICFLIKVEIDVTDARVVSAHLKDGPAHQHHFTT